MSKEVKEEPVVGAVEDDDDQFEVTQINTVTQKLDEVKLDDQKEPGKEGKTKLTASSKEFTAPGTSGAKLTKGTRVFNPKPKEEDKNKPKLSNKGRTFKPQNRDEEVKEQAYGGEYYDQQNDGYGFNEGKPEYLDNQDDVEEFEDDFYRFQHQTDQIEKLQETIGEFGEGLIRFEESSRNCECCQGLVDRCDGEICDTLGECYCVSHNKNNA